MRDIIFRPLQHLNTEQLSSVFARSSKFSRRNKGSAEARRLELRQQVNILSRQKRWHEIFTMIPPVSPVPTLALTWPQGLLPHSAPNFHWEDWGSHFPKVLLLLRMWHLSALRQGSEETHQPFFTLQACVQGAPSVTIPRHGSWHLPPTELGSVLLCLQHPTPTFEGAGEV